MDTSVIILCAGFSKRMNGEEKMLLKIGGIEIAGMSMLVFQAAPSVKEIIIVTRKELTGHIKKTADELNITKMKEICTGGNTRQDSMVCGLKKISPDTEYIAVHDGARPLISSKMVENVIADARIFGGAALGVPVKDTIKAVSGGLVTDTLPRSSLYITQTPQVFRRSKFLYAVDFALEHGLDFTDDCQLAEAIGVKIHMTMGDYRNIKVTTPEDIVIANILNRGGLNENRPRV